MPCVRDDDLGAAPPGVGSQQAGHRPGHGAQVRLLHLSARHRHHSAIQEAPTIHSG